MRDTDGLVVEEREPRRLGVCVGVLPGVLDTETLRLVVEEAVEDAVEDRVVPGVFVNVGVSVWVGVRGMVGLTVGDLDMRIEDVSVRVVRIV